MELAYGDCLRRVVQKGVASLNVSELEGGEALAGKATSNARINKWKNLSRKRAEKHEEEKARDEWRSEA